MFALTHMQLGFAFTKNGKLIENEIWGGGRSLILYPHWHLRIDNTWERVFEWG